MFIFDLVVSLGASVYWVWCLSAFWHIVIIHWEGIAPRIVKECTLGCNKIGRTPPLETRTIFQFGTPVVETSRVNCSQALGTLVKEALRTFSQTLRVSIS